MENTPTKARSSLRVLITGAGGGIGMATARVLAYRGHSVIATDLSGPSAPEGIQARVLDVTSDDSVARCLEEVGPLDAIVNNAGIFGGGPVEGYPLDRIRQMTANDYITSKWLVLIRPLVAGFDRPLTPRPTN